MAKAIATASEIERHLYIERRGELFRWSLAHRGGSYPLLRITARFLDVDYQRIYVGFRTLPNGYSIICENPSDFDDPDAWCILDLDDQLSDAAAGALISSSLGATDAN